MAGRDYLGCKECGRRLVYDGRDTIRDALDWEPIYCSKCWQKLLKKIETLRKHDRRKH